MQLNYGNRPINIQIPDDEYTPTDLINLLNDNLTGQVKSASMITLKGICTDLNYVERKGFYFGKLEDEEYRFVITLKIPAALFDEFSNDITYSLKGIVEKQIYYNADAGIKFVFHVKEIIDSSKANLLTERKNKIEELLNEKRQKIHVEDNLLAMLSMKKKPKILIITGNDSVALHDIMQSIGNSKYSYQLDEYKINLRKPEEISSAIRSSAHKYDLVALVRGGGSETELNILSDPIILESALNVKNGFVTAIGHFSDTTYLDQIADVSYGTPSDLGRRLSDLSLRSYNETRKKNNSSPNFVTYVAVVGFVIMVILYFMK